MQKRGPQLQQLLEEQSEQIERVFMQHRIPTRVSGGEIRSPWIRFDLQTTLAAGRERMESLRHDLMAALGAAVVNITGDAENWQIAVRPEAPVPVALLPLLAELPEVPPVTAVLGLADDGRPLLLDLTAESACHALIAGNRGSGKSALLRTAALSLAYCNRQSRLQMIMLDGDALQDGHRATPFRPLEYLPHMLNPVIEMADDAAAALAFVDGELSYRLEQEISTPAIVLFIDNINAVIRATEGEGMKYLMRLAQDGARAGIHLLLTTANPGDGALDALFRANIPVKLVGQVDDERDAWAASGLAGSQAEYLEGKGDFLAVVGDVMTRFQAAYVRPAELPGILEQTYRSPRPAILAQPAGDDDERLPGAPEQGRSFIVAQDQLPVIRFADEAEPEIIDIELEADDVAFEPEEAAPWQETVVTRERPATLPSVPGRPVNRMNRAEDVFDGPSNRAYGPASDRPDQRLDLDETEPAEPAPRPRVNLAGPPARPNRRPPRAARPSASGPVSGRGTEETVRRPEVRQEKLWSGTDDGKAEVPGKQLGRPVFSSGSGPAPAVAKPDEFMEDVVYEDLDDEIPFE